MKFSQYAIGIGLAILIFSGAIFSEYSKYQKISFLEQNPFSLVGEHNYPEKGYHDVFSDNGEFIRIFGDSNVNFAKESREIIDGTVFLVGSFFNDNNLEKNFINLGDLILRYPASNIIISRNSKTQTSTILNYGRTIELYFPEQEIPFLIPSEYQITINDRGEFPLSKNENYYKYSKEFKLSLIDWSSELATFLKKGSENFYSIRRSFKEFATKMPNIWQKGDFDFLKFNFIGQTKNSPKIESFLSRFRETQKSLEKNEEIYKRVIENDFSEIEFELKDKNFLELLRTNDKWNLFEKSQKIWLPSINDNSTEWIYRKLWSNKRTPLDNVKQDLDTAEFFSFNLYGEAIDKELLSLKKELEHINTSNLTKFEISSIRRRFYYLMKNQIEYENISKSNINNFSYLLEKELESYKESPDSLSLIKEEMSYNLIDIINKYINKEDSFSRYLTSVLINIIQNNINIDKFIETVDNENILEIIKKIKMVGLSGLTPKEYKELHNIKEEEKVLNDLIKKPINTPKEKNEINNSKKLWQFLQKENISLNIQSFRTKRNSLYFETRFENTESGKRRISGIFDYNKQIFKILTLGTASIRKIEPNFLALWMKQIRGKFEPIKIEETPKVIEEEIPQNSRKAILNKQFLKDLLDSLNFQISKSDITITSHDLNIMHATNIIIKEPDIKVTPITLDYDLESREFYNIFILEGGNKEKIYLSEAPINGKTLQEIVREKLKKEEKE